jgi:hypothetical protein
MPPMYNPFKADEDAKAMQIGTKNLAKIVQIRATLDPKYASELVDFL